MVGICGAHLVANDSGRYRLPEKTEKSYAIGYDLEMDVKPELGPDTASYIQTIIGILRWIVEHGRNNLKFTVLLLLLHIALPREGIWINSHIVANMGQK